MNQIESTQFQILKCKWDNLNLPYLGRVFSVTIPHLKLLGPRGSRDKIFTPDNLLPIIVLTKLNWINHMKEEHFKNRYLVLILPAGGTI